MKKIIRFSIGTLFVLMLPWSNPATAQTNPADFKIGLWSVRDSLWVFDYGKQQWDSTLSLSSIYIPIERTVSISRQIGKPSLVFLDEDGKVKLVSLHDITGNPVETEMWRKLIIKAKHGDYQYLYDFIIEVFCHTGGEYVPMAMNDIFNDIQLAFACNTREFPTSPRGIYYCLEEYTRLKLAGRVPINDLDEETRLIKGGRPAFRKVALLPSSFIYRQSY